MNTQEIESKSKAEIKRLLGSISWLNDVQISDVRGPMDPGYDMEARFSTGDGNEGILQIEFEAFPRPSQFPSVHQISRYSNGNSRRSSEIPVLAVPRISPRMAELCEEHGWFRKVPGNWTFVAIRRVAEVPWSRGRVMRPRFARSR